MRTLYELDKALSKRQLKIKVSRNKDKVSQLFIWTVTLYNAHNQRLTITESDTLESAITETINYYDKSLS